MRNGRILPLSLIFLFINFTRSQLYGGEMNSYASAYSGGNGYSYVEREATFYRQKQPEKTTTIIEEVVRTPAGSTKVITRQQQQPPYGYSVG
jgi:hypothetical protein